MALTKDDHSLIIKQGTLQRYSSREQRWVKKYYVLYDTSTKNAARLDWYDDDKTFKATPQVRKTLFVEAISRVERAVPDAESKAKYGDINKNTLLIHMHQGIVNVLKASNEQAAVDWQRAINNLVEQARTMSLVSRTKITDSLSASGAPVYQPHPASCVTFDVEVDDTTAANSCQLYGQYNLVLSPQHITLIDPKVDEPAISWLYNHVRRYGFSGETFTLEAGHKSGSAAGLFIFKNCQGAAIRSAMEEKMRSIQRQQQEQEQGDTYAYVDLGSVKSSGSSGSSSSIDRSPTSPCPTGPVPLGLPLTKPKPLVKTKAASADGSSDGSGVSASSSNASKPTACPRPTKQQSNPDGAAVRPTVSPRNSNSVPNTIAAGSSAGGGGSSPGVPPKPSAVIQQLAAANARKAAAMTKQNSAPTADSNYATIDLVKEAAARRTTNTGSGGGVAGRTAAASGPGLSSTSPEIGQDDPANLYGPLLLKQMKVNEESAYAEISQVLMN